MLQGAQFAWSLYNTFRYLGTGHIEFDSSILCYRYFAVDTFAVDNFAVVLILFDS